MRTGSLSFRLVLSVLLISSVEGTSAVWSSLMALQTTFRSSLRNRICHITGCHETLDDCRWYFKSSLLLKMMERSGPECARCNNIVHSTARHSLWTATGFCFELVRVHDHCAIAQKCSLPIFTVARILVVSRMRWWRLYSSWSPVGVLVSADLEILFFMFSMAYVSAKIEKVKSMYS